MPSTESTVALLERKNRELRGENKRLQNLLTDIWTHYKHEFSQAMVERIMYNVGISPRGGTDD